MVLASGDDSSLVSPRVGFTPQNKLGGDLGVDQEFATGITFHTWTGNALGFLMSARMRCYGEGQLEHSALPVATVAHLLYRNVISWRQGRYCQTKSLIICVAGLVGVPRHEILIASLFSIF